MGLTGRARLTVTRECLTKPSRGWGEREYQPSQIARRTPFPMEIYGKFLENDQRVALREDCPASSSSAGESGLTEML